MTTRVEKCKWCRTKVVVPQDAQTITCTKCGVFVNLPPNKTDGNLFGGVGKGRLRGMIKQGVSTTIQKAQVLVKTHLGIINPFGPKRAVLCGVSYRGHPKELKGSVNDVKSLRNLLIDRFGFPHASICVLTEDEKDPSRIPTKINIRRALTWLVQGCQAGDSLVFHYSGHGSRVRDQHGDELDGHDACLCPLDYETEGRILDDELNTTLVRPLTSKVTLHAIIDTCYSGTFLDLPYMCRVNKDGYYRWEDHRILNNPGYNKGTSGGLAICISACDERQTSGDTTAFNGKPNGALTYNFVETLEKETKLTYAQLLTAMRYLIYRGQRAAGNWGPIQEPQLSCSESFDIHLNAFNL